MQITRTSVVSGKDHTLEVPITPEQLDAYEGGELLLQDAFPSLDPALREFIKTGITPDEYQTLVLGKRRQRR